MQEESAKGARQPGLIGVTGSSGKTTTCHLIEAILQDGCPPGALASSEVQRIGERAVMIDQTGMEPVALGDFQWAAREAGVRWAVVELDPVHLSTGRPAGTDAHSDADERSVDVAHLGLDPAEMEIAIVTNLTEGDQASVSTWIRSLSPEPEAGRPQAVVLNRDDPVVMPLADRRHVPLLTFGLHPEADVRATAVEASLEGAKFFLHLPGAEPEPCHLQLLGEHNVANALAAATVGHLLGLCPATIARALFRCPGLPGRMERIEEGQPFHVVVDWADSPVRLAQVARFRPPGAERVRFFANINGGNGASWQRAFRVAVAEARHGDLLLLCGRPEAPCNEAVIREVLRDSLL